MTPELYRKASRLYDEALEIDPESRDDFLDRSCEGDDELRREVESLLRAHDNVGDYFAAPALEVAAGLVTQRQNLSLMGRSLSHYRVLRLIGAGGMGEVHLAEDKRLGRKVALKMLPREFTQDPERVRRFEQEARAASALNHPNIVTIYEVGNIEGRYFIATEYIEGQTLRERLMGGQIELREVVEVATQMASALEAAHEAGIVHRDIKPENVMVRRDGLVKVLDFGLAKLAERQSQSRGPEVTTEVGVQSTPGLVMGTLSYMSPEQARGERLDERTDIFSLGVVLYEMVAGQSPFAAASGAETLAAILEREPKPLAQYAQKLPNELERIVEKALRKKREERYQAAGDLAIDLKSLKEELGVEARLKRTQHGETDSGSARRQSGGQAAVATLENPAVRTDDLATARTMSSAEYLIGEIKRRKLWTAIVAAVLIAVAAIAYYIYPTSSGEAIDSIAVLPFANVGGNPDAEYLSDGISDSIINSLSQLPSIKRVISLNSALRYKGQQVDPRAVGRDFNVKAVLMGSLTQQGDGLLISAELVDVKDDRRLWGEQYNRKLSDILVVQREIAQQISSGLRLRLSGEEKKEIAKQYTENPNAEIAYLKGRYFLQKRSGTNVEKSVEYLEEAIRLDPNYALAYATLANAYLGRASLGLFRLEEVLPKAKEAVEKALAIDGELAEARSVLGGIRFYEWDWPGAEREFKRAIELNPNYKPTHPIYERYLMHMKRYDEAVAESKRVLELDPVSAYYNRNVGMILYFARRYDEAIEQIQKTLELEPDMGVAWNWMWRAYEQKGQYDKSVEAYLKFYSPIKRQGPEAVAAFREVYAKSGWKGFWQKVLDLHMEQVKQGFNLHGLAENYARLGERDQALFWLEKAVEQRDVTITAHCRNPFWDGYRSDPRFANLIRRMGLEP
jgi:serine/threonine-protein kinase